MMDQDWKLCTSPKVGDTLKWLEPLWAPPNKPRGKRDKIGEQEITATLIECAEIMELQVISVQKTSSGEALLSVQENDHIKRKRSSIEKGNCRSLIKSVV